MNFGFSFSPEGLGCFFQVRVCLDLKWTHAAAGSLVAAFLVSPSTPWSSFIKHSGIPCGIKPADGHSGSDGQDLPLEASNSNCSWFQETRGRRALAATKCCWKSHLSPWTGCTCFLICITPLILLANVAAICQQLQKLLEWHLSPLHPKEGRGEKRWGVSMPQGLPRCCSEWPDPAHLTEAPTKADWQKWVSGMIRNQRKH